MPFCCILVLKIARISILLSYGMNTHHDKMQVRFCVMYCIRIINSIQYKYYFCIVYLPLIAQAIPLTSSGTDINTTLISQMFFSKLQEEKKNTKNITKASHYLLYGVEMKFQTQSGSFLDPTIESVCDPISATHISITRVDAVSVSIYTM